MIATSRLEQICAALADLQHWKSGGLATNRDPASYLEKAFQVCCRAFEIQVGAYWMMLPGGGLSLVGHSGVSNGVFGHDSLFAENLAPQLLEAFKNPRLTIVPPEQQPYLSHSTSQSMAATLLIIPICTTDETAEKQCKSVFTLWLDLDGAADQRFLRGMQELVAEMEEDLRQAIQQKKSQAPRQGWTRVLPKQSSRHPSLPAPNPNSAEHPPKQLVVGGTAEQDRQRLQRQSSFLQLAKIIGRELNTDAVAYAIVNEMRNCFGCGRIGLSLVRGAKCRVVALSGVETFDPRSPVIVTLQKLTSAMAKGGDAWWLPEQSDELTSDLNALVNEYYEVTDASSVALLPIYAPRERDKDPENLAAVVADPSEQRGELLAVLSVEGIQQEILRQDIEDAWTEAQPLVANAVQNSVRFARIPLLPMWLACGSVLELFRGYQRRRAYAISTAAILILACLVLIPSELRLASPGVVQPSKRTRIYAEVPGTVSAVRVADGAAVEAGAPLLELTNPDIAIEFERIQGDYRETHQALMAINDQLNANLVADEAATRALRKERVALEEKHQSLGKQLELLELKRRKLQIVSPLAGRVITWELPQRLGQRPVEPGQHLMTVADIQGPWELELQLPDKLSGHLRRAWDSKSIEKPMWVDFVLASDPTHKYRGQVRQIADSTSLDAEVGSVLRVSVEIPLGGGDAEQWTRSVKPGTEVIAHIHAGQHALGYCWLFGFFDWINRTWFKYLG